MAKPIMAVLIAVVAFSIFSGKDALPMRREEMRQKSQSGKSETND